MFFSSERHNNLLCTVGPWSALRAHEVYARLNLHVRYLSREIQATIDNATSGDLRSGSSIGIK